MKRVFYFLLVAGFSLFFIGQLYAQTLTINNSPRPFTVVTPNSWVQQNTSTGNSRVSFVSPSGTPSAECAVIVKEMPSISDLSQSFLDQQMALPPDVNSFAAQMSARFNNVQVLKTGFATISGHPAQLVSFQYSVGSPNGEIWSHAVTISSATTPGLVWTISCSASGRTTAEANKSYSYWQSEILRFPTNVKIK